MTQETKQKGQLNITIKNIDDTKYNISIIYFKSIHDSEEIFNSEVIIDSDIFNKVQAFINNATSTYNITYVNTTDDTLSIQLDVLGELNNVPIR